MRLRGNDDSESSDNSEHERRIAASVNELMGAFARPKGRKRGGVRHKKSSTPKKNPIDQVRLFGGFQVTLVFQVSRCFQTIFFN